MFQTLAVVTLSTVNHKFLQKALTANRKPCGYMHSRNLIDSYQPARFTLCQGPQHLDTWELMLHLKTFENVILFSSFFCSSQCPKMRLSVRM